MKFAKEQKEWSYMEKQGNLLEERMEEVQNLENESQRDYRLIPTALMGIFVVIVMCWGVYSMVQDIEKGQSGYQTLEAQIKKNESSAGETLEVDKLVENLLEKVTFETELKRLDDSVAEGMVTSESGTKLQIYMGNGSFADEIVIMTSKNENAAKRNQENVKAHLDEMGKMFQDYIPKEAKKIDNAVMVRCGCYVIVCVTNDTDTAAVVINDIIEQ